MGVLSGAGSSYLFWTDNTMAKRNRKKDKQLPTKLYTENSNFSDVNSLKI
jgi:hypothetical protein